MTLGAPLWLLLLIPATAAFWKTRLRKRHQALRYPSLKLFPSRALHSWRIEIYRAIPWLYGLVMLLVIVAMARPRSIIDSTTTQTDAIAIQMTVDISGSMDALDLSPQSALGTTYKTRLDVVKDTFADFIAARPHDLIGLITFGGYASTLSPLTIDHEALAHILSGVTTPRPIADPSGNIINEDERLTAIGDALATACARLKDAEPVSKIIVLLSDGESNAGIIEVATAVATAKSMGIKVYTIGIGTQGRAPILITDPAGRQTIRNVRIDFDEATLRSIAEETGGTYFNVQNRKGLEDALTSIDELETTAIETEQYFRYREWYSLFLLPALLILILTVTLHLRLMNRII